MIKTVTLIIIMMLIVPLDSYGIKSIVIGKGMYIDGFKEGKMNSILRNRMRIVVQLINNSDKAMILLNNGKGELHLHGTDSKEYKFTYK